MTLSRETWWLPSPHVAILAAVTALTGTPILAPAFVLALGEAAGIVTCAVRHDCTAMDCDAAGAFHPSMEDEGVAG
ncbi:hypothetical protein OG905_17835 [Streptomyces sp. NBC_00322]|uniref:hypothetical protein n=1 Tax=Streptomyces sp. NBC_00322 TaxID=2975712 RepID=UPI002E2AB5AE|nr:hypothetical protein [Streptomyces sp. NBC_00322]